MDLVQIPLTVPNEAAGEVLSKSIECAFKNSRTYHIP